ncbi:TIGR02206 family membrane protein [Flavobacteriaceae bacterium]|nr:TIGR02206 family membrane protein [Flavobacteriaceae bacterium]
MFLTNQTFPNYVIKFMSDEWIVNNCAVLVVIIFVLILGRFLSRQQNVRVTYFMGVILFFTSVVTPLRTALNGNWNIVTDLPFHLCGISGLICSFLPFLRRKQALFDFVFYTGVIGGVMSVLTPQMNGFDGSNFAYFEYYVRHVLIFLLPLYMLQNLNIRPSKYSVLRSFGILNILLVIIMPLNFYLGSNYMYLAEPPEAKNPLIIGVWPYYLLWFELFIFVLMSLFYGLSTLKFNTKRN